MVIKTKKQTTMNKKIIFILAGVVLTAMTSLTMTSCDDDHFTVDPTIAGKGNVWDLSKTLFGKTIFEF